MQNFNLSLPDATAICEKMALSPPQRLIKLTEGMINDVFSIDDLGVIKINTGHPDMPKLEKERDIYGLLQGKVPVPQVYGLDASRKILSYPYIVMEYVKGNSFNSEYQALPEEEKSLWLLKLGEVLSQIHSVTFSEFGEAFVNGEFKGKQNYREYIIEYVWSICSALEKTNAWKDSEVEGIIQFFKESALFQINPNAVLLHGNFIPANILASNGTLTAVVDWEWARSGHNEEEVAVFLYRNLNMNPKLLASFRSGYEQFISLPPEFEERLYAYNLLYYLRVFPEIKKWVHRPDKQKEYTDEIKKLLKIVVWIEWN